MTQEQKAKAYDEALAWMRELYPGLHGATKEDAEHYFPELRESEDERIRKEIINYLDFAESHNLLRAADYKKKKGWVTYFEKQKDAFENGRQLGIMQEQARQELEWIDEKQQEQKPNIELIQRSWYMEGYNDRDFFMEPKWILKTGEGGPKYEPNPRYGKSLILGTEPCSCSVNVESEYDKGWRDGHKAGLKDADVQKPAWSEEDENRLNAVVELLENTSAIHPNYSRRKLIIWLKSLRPQPKEEWTDEYLDKLFGKGKHQPFYKELLIAGAKCQKEQMMKEAVEGIVMNFSSNEPQPTVIVEAKGFNQGDKVRVIVLPKED